MKSERATASCVPVRRVAGADLREVYEIERAAFPQPWPYSAFQRHSDAPGFLVAESRGDADGITGFVVADTVPNHGAPLGHVKDLAVRANRRREGIGWALLCEAIGRLESAGAERTKLEVRRSNDAALALYERAGFRSVRTVPRYYDDGEAAVVMVWR